MSSLAIFHGREGTMSTAPVAIAARGIPSCFRGLRLLRDGDPPERFDLGEGASGAVRRRA